MLQKYVIDPYAAFYKRNTLFFLYIFYVIFIVNFVLLDVACFNPVKFVYQVLLVLFGSAPSFM